MVNPWVILSSLGGIVAFLGLVGLIIRAIFRQINATEDNTTAVRNLTRQVEALNTKVGELEKKVIILEDRIRRNGTGSQSRV